MNNVWCFLLCFCCLVLKISAQSLTFDFHQVPLSEALSAIDHAAEDYTLTCVLSDLEHLRVSARIKGLTAPEAVERLCKGQPVKVKTKGNQIFIQYRKKKDRTIALWGHVRDSFTKRGILNAKITLTTEEGFVLDTMRTWKPNNDFADAVYRFDVPVAPQKYVIMAEHPDYETTTVEYDLRYVARNTFFDVPHHFMPRRSRNSLLGGQLQEVVVKATKVQMVYRGDTIIYNADAFNVPEGSMLDALIRQMPGTELKENGEIYVHGRKIDYLTLNGEDFFKGKNKVMLENLPYYVVQNIKVYDRQTEKSEWLGTSDGPKDYVMDVTLKREYNRGYMANADAGWGTHDRYMGKLFGARFTDHSRIVAFVNANNTNETRQPGMEGDWNPAKDMGNGVRKYTDAGALLEINDKEKRWKERAGAELQWSNSQADVQRARKYFQSATGNYTRQHVRNDGRDFRLGAQNVFTLRKPFWWNNTLYGKYFRNTVDARNRTARFLSDPSRFGNTVQVLDSLLADQSGSQLLPLVVNFSDIDARLHYSSWELQYDFNLDYKFPWGDDFELAGNIDYTRDKTEEAERQMASGATSDNRHSHLWQRESDFDWWVRAKYTIHTLARWHYRAFLAYQRQNLQNDYDRYRLDQLPHWFEEAYTLEALPSTREAMQQALDQTNAFNQHTQKQHWTPGLFVYYEKEGKEGSTRFTVELPLHLERVHTDYRSALLDTVSTRHFTVPTPQVELTLKWHNFDRYLWLKYGTSYSFPNDLTWMVASRRSTNPLYVSLGNPDLKHTFTHKFVVNLSDRVRAINQTTTFSGGLDIVQNAAANGRTYDPQTGITTNQYENVSGNWSAWAQVQWGRNLDKANHFYVEVFPVASFDHSVDISAVTSEADRLSKVNTWTLKNTARLRYQYDQFSVGINCAVKYLASRSERAHFQPLNTWEYNYGLTAQYTFPWRLQVATDLKMYSRRGYTDSSMNADELVWNASLSYPFWKNRFVLRLEGFDLLSKLSNVYYSVNAQGQTETWRNCVPSYVMLHLQWKFNHIPKKK